METNQLCELGLTRFSLKWHHDDDGILYNEWLRWIRFISLRSMMTRELGRHKERPKKESNVKERKLKWRRKRKDRLKNKIVKGYSHQESVTHTCVESIRTLTAENRNYKKNTEQQQQKQKHNEFTVSSKSEERYTESKRDREKNEECVKHQTPITYGDEMK